MMAEDPFPEDDTLATEVLRAWERAEVMLKIHVKPTGGVTHPVSFYLPYELSTDFAI